MKNNLKLILLPAMFIAILATTACGRLSDENSVWNRTREEEEVNNAPSTTTTAMTYTPGIFAGVSDIRGYNGNISVEVTIDADGRISGIEVTDHAESDGFYQRAFDNLIPLIISSQTTNVDIDAASGATYSAGALISAINNALSQAGGVLGAESVAVEADFTPGTFTATSDIRGYNGPITVEVTIDANGHISGVEVTDHAESDGFYQRAFDNLIPLIISSQTANVDIDAASGATYSSKALLDAINNALSQAGGVLGVESVAVEADFTPGTFVATSDIRGYNGPISVEVTIDANGHITGVEVTDHVESDGFYQRAFDNLIPLIISSQTTDVDIDAASGATYSSKALLDAVQNALNDAR